MPSTISLGLTPSLVRMAQKVLEAYKADYLDREGHEDAYFETAEHTVKHLIPNLHAAIRFVNELCEAGYGLIVPDREDQEALLPTLAAWHQEGSSFKPLDLLEFIRGVARAHIWDQLRNEANAIRVQRGECPAG
ncbi:hypothetical protein EPO04_02735 [Patescibacteria group bacterium]|nr:MAG: hypothetical protein EPO04_02735 [Patescibacteria group bacterium]